MLPPSPVPPQRGVRSWGGSRGSGWCPGRPPLGRGVYWKEAESLGTLDVLRQVVLSQAPVVPTWRRGQEEEAIGLRDSLSDRMV